jgi:hypothetical protein
VRREVELHELDHACLVKCKGRDVGWHVDKVEDVDIEDRDDEMLGQLDVVVPQLWEHEAMHTRASPASWTMVINRLVGWTVEEQGGLGFLLRTRFVFNKVSISYH